jgi:hypothetical protein
VPHTIEQRHTEKAQRDSERLADQQRSLDLRDQRLEGRQREVDAREAAVGAREARAREEEKVSDVDHTTRPSLCHAPASLVADVPNFHPPSHACPERPTPALPGQRRCPPPLATCPRLLPRLCLCCSLRAERLPWQRPTLSAAVTRT